MNKPFDYIMAKDGIKIESLRYDYVLSNWLFVWFLLYWFGILRFSPLLAILIGLVCNTIGFILVQKWKSVAWRKHYILWNMNIKFWPAVILLGKKNQINWKQDILVMIGFFLLFLCWGLINSLMNGRINPYYNARNPFDFNSRDTADQ